MSDTCSVCMRDVDDGVSCGDCMYDYEPELWRLRKLLTRIKGKAWSAADAGGVSDMHKALLSIADMAASGETE